MSQRVRKVNKLARNLINHFFSFSGKGRLYISLLLIILLILPAPGFAREDKNIPNTILNFIPSYGHFRKGEWQKGISDLWNTWMAIWAILEPNATIGRWEKDIRETDQPGSYRYTTLTRNIEIYRELQFWMFTMIFINYLNSIFDIYLSPGGASFFGLYVAEHFYNYNTFIKIRDEFQPYQGLKTGPHFGAIFGYKGILRTYFKMYFPRAGVHYALWITEGVIPFGTHKNICFYTGIGFSGVGYMDNFDWEKVKNVIEGGLGTHLRLGVSYLYKTKHFFKFTFVPYLFQTDIRAYDEAIVGREDSWDQERFTRGHFPENFGLQLIYKYRFSSHLYIESCFEFIRAVETGRSYIDYQPDGGQYIWHTDDLIMRSLIADFSVNYNF